MTAAGYIGCVLIIVAINVTIGGFATEYVVEYWGSYFKGYQVDVPFFPCAVAGVFLGQFTIPLAVCTWILSFVL